MPRQWVSWGKQATKERFPKSKPIPGPKDQGFPHTREQQPKGNKPNKKRVNPQPWSTTGRTTGPYQPGGGPRSLSPPRCRRSTQGFGDAHSRRDGTQNLEPKHHRSVTTATSLMMILTMANHNIYMYNKRTHQNGPSSVLKGPGPPRQTRRSPAKPPMEWPWAPASWITATSPGVGSTLRARSTANLSLFSQRPTASRRSHGSIQRAGRMPLIVSSNLGIFGKWGPNMCCSRRGLGIHG